MATKFYINATNDYIGGFDGATPPAGSVQVPTAPPDARCKWIPASSTWGAVTLTVQEKVGPEVQKRLVLFAMAVCDAIIRNDKTALTAIDTALQNLKNS